MRDFSKLLSPLKRKLNAEIWLGHFLASLVLALALALAVILLSKFFYIKYIERIIVLEALFFLLVSFVRLAVRPATLKDAAKAGDALGLEERLSTALEIVENGKTGGVYDMAVNDALDKGEKSNLKKLYKIKLPQKTLKIAAVLAVAVVASGFVKNPQNADIGKMVQPQIKELEEIKKVLNSEKSINDDELDKINKEINSVTKKLEQSASKKDALKNIDEAQQELKNLEKTGAPKDMQSLAQSLEGQNGANKLLKGTKQSAAEGLEELNSAAKELSGEELEKLLEQLQNAAENIDSEELKEAVENYAGELSAGNFDGASNGLEKLKEAAAKTAGQSQSLKAAVGEINQTLAQAAQNIEKPEPGAGQGAGNGNGSGNGQGNDNDAGQGQGSGQGTGSGAGRGRGHVETEEEFSRDAAGKAGYESQVGGAENEGGKKEMTIHRAQGSSGELVPYDEVLGEYKEEALKSIDESQAPYGMKKLVADYFSELEK